MRKKLTAAALANDTLGEGEYWDIGHPGLHLRIGKARKTWRYRFRLGNKQPRETLGYYPVMGLSEARIAAAGIDKRLDAGLPAAAPAPVVHPRSAPTLDDLFGRYEKLRQAEGRRTKSLRRTMMTLRYCLRQYLSVPAHEFSKADLRAARDVVSERAPAQANALLRILAPVLKWASQEDLIPGNFVADIRKGPDRKRERVLTGDELRAVWHACEKGDLGTGSASRSYRRLVRFLMITGCRLGEAAALKHGDVLDGTWRQAAESNKAGRKHSVPLPQLALELLGEGTATQLCFPGQRGQLNGFGLLKEKLDEASGVSGWVIHDLRRTVVTGLGDLGVDELAIKAVINHALTSGALSHYLHSELEKQKRAALQAWADKLARIVGSRRAVS